MNWLLAALIAVILLGGWMLLRRRQSSSAPSTKPPADHSTAESKYHAVSIKFASNACKAAREMEGRRFLSGAAPRLPLPECDVNDCRCRFVHHKDRRAGRDRRSPFGPSGFGGAATGTHKVEQRQGKDRRHEDDDDLF